MGYETGIILGIVGTSLVLSFIATSLDSNDYFMKAIKYFLFGVSVAMLFLIPSVNLHVITEANSTGIIINNANALTNNMTTQLDITIWTFVALCFFILAWGFWKAMSNWFGRRTKI